MPQTQVGISTPGYLSCSLVVVLKPLRHEHKFVGKAVPSLSDSFLGQGAAPTYGAVCLTGGEGQSVMRCC